MAKTVTHMSVAELERALSLKVTKLEKLSSKKEGLLKELDRVEKKIRELGGASSERKTKRKGRRGKRPKNAQPLSGYIKEMLGRTKKGFTVDEIHDKLLESGYKTNSKNFRNVVYQNLYHSEEVAQDADTGRYQLKS